MKGRTRKLSQTIFQSQGSGHKSSKNNQENKKLHFEIYFLFERSAGIVKSKLARTGQCHVIYTKTDCIEFFELIAEKH